LITSWRAGFWSSGSLLSSASQISITLGC
jgi:hypothetical protein